MPNGVKYIYSPPTVTSPSNRNYQIDNPTAGTQIKIGSGTSTFANKILFSAFDGEATFSLNLPLGAFSSVSLTGTREVAQITTQNTNYGLVYKPTPPKAGYNDLGGLDFIITLRKKLATPPSSFIFTLGDKSNVVGYVQLSLTPQEIAEGDIRPDYVVNSIAFYHSSKDRKIGHLYRMQAVDSLGNKVWLDWSMPTSTQVVLTDTTGFLKIGTYPITIQPVGDTFGFTGVGGTSSDSAAIRACKFTSGGAGTSSVVSVYADRADITIGAAIYSDVAGTCTTKLAEDSGNLPSGSGTWLDIPVSCVIVAATVYWLAGWGNASFIMQWDDGAANQAAHVAATWETWPSPYNSGDYRARKYSIHCDVVAGGGTTTNVTSSNYIQVNPVTVSKIWTATRSCSPTLTLTSTPTKLWQPTRTSSPILNLLPVPTMGWQAIRSSSTIFTLSTSADVLAGKFFEAVTEIILNATASISVTFGRIASTILNIEAIPSIFKQFTISASNTINLLASAVVLKFRLFEATTQLIMDASATVAVTFERIAETIINLVTDASRILTIPRTSNVALSLIASAVKSREKLASVIINLNASASRLVHWNPTASPTISLFTLSSVVSALWIKARERIRHNRGLKPFRWRTR